MKQIPDSGLYCGGCPCHYTTVHIMFEVQEKGCCARYDNKQTVAGMDYGYLRLPECIKDKPQIISTAKFNHEAYGKLWEEISEEFMGETSGTNKKRTI